MGVHARDGGGIGTPEKALHPSLDTLYKAAELSGRIGARLSMVVFERRKTGAEGSRRMFITGYDRNPN